MEPFQIFALFTWNFWNVIFPSKMSNNILVDPCWQYLFAIFLSFSSWVTKCPCNHTFAVQKFGRSPCWPLAIQIFHCTGQKFDLDFNVQIFVWPVPCERSLKPLGQHHWMTSPPDLQSTEYLCWKYFRKSNYVQDQSRVSYWSDMKKDNNLTLTHQRNLKKVHWWNPKMLHFSWLWSLTIY